MDTFEMTTFVIPNGTATIVMDSLEEWGVSKENLTTVIIPESVTTIGNRAFQKCVALAEVKFSDSITSIGDCAFQGCRALSEIAIPDSVISIGTYAFFGCSVLAAVTIPDSVTSIGEGAFQHCRALARAKIPASVTSIGHGAFAWTNGAFDGCPPHLVLDMGLVADAQAPNRFPGINQFLRTATLRHTLPSGETYVVQHEWRAGSATPGPPTVVETSRRRHFPHGRRVPGTNLRKKRSSIVTGNSPPRSKTLSRNSVGI